MGGIPKNLRYGREEIKRRRKLNSLNEPFRCHSKI
jgi:hypothetical protein